MTESQLGSSQRVVPTYTKIENQPLSLSKVFSTGCMYASTITVLTEESLTFKQHWERISQHRFIEIEKYKLQELKFHKVKGKLWENIAESFSTKAEVGVLYYLLHQAWIPYIHQRAFMFLFVDSDNWLSHFMSDFQEFREVVSEYLISIYSKQIIQAEDIVHKMFQVLAQAMTGHQKWEKVDNVLARIVSRLKNKVRVHPHITHELFELEAKQFPDIHFVKEVSLLREVYSEPSIKVKKQKLCQFQQMVYEKFYYKQISAAIEYCFLLTGLNGFPEMLEYISQLGQFEGKEKEEIDSLKIIALKLSSRDSTGFTNDKIESSCNENVLSRKSWRFLFNRRSEFMFINPLKISHNEPTWQTIVSWNYLKPDCEIPISLNIKNNFIKVGLIFDCKDIEECRDYTRSDKVAIYCFSTGTFFRNGEQSRHTSFKKNPITRIQLKAVKGVVSWSVVSKQGSELAISHQFDQKLLFKSRMILIFRKGSLEVFPQPN